MNDPPMSPNRFDLVTSTLMFDLLIKNFNLGYNFQMACTRMLIFNMSIPCGKTFPWVPKDLTLTLEFDLLVENFNLAIFFDW